MNRRTATLLFCFLMLSLPLSSQPSTTIGYQALVDLFEAWRQFEKPPLKDGAPDYTLATREARWPEFKELQASLLAMDTTGWSVPEKVDWTIVWAEMNGYDFNHRIL